MNFIKYKYASKKQQTKFYINKYIKSVTSV